MRTACSIATSGRRTSLLSDEAPISTAVLTNFSLGCDADAGTATSEDSLDTALYRSPEHAGSMDYDVGATSDLYSAGIVLFECLAGHPPFSGDTVGAVLLTHMTSHVPGTASRGTERSPSLGRTDPAAAAQGSPRPLSNGRGRVGRPGGNRRIAARRRRRVRLRRRIARSPPHAHRTGVRRPPTTTWSKWTSRFSRWPPDRRTSSSRGRIGRRQDAASRRSRPARRQKGMWVLHGRGLEMVGQQPFQVLHGIVEHVIAAARVDPCLRRQTCTIAWATTPPPSPPCCRNWLAALGWEESGAAGPESFAETRSIQALAAFLAALGDKGSPGHDHPRRLPMGRRNDGQADRALAAGAGRLGRRRVIRRCWSSRSVRRKCRPTIRSARFALRSTCAWPPWRPTTCAACWSRWPGRCPPRPSRSSRNSPTAARSWPPPCCAGWSSRGPGRPSRPAGASSRWPWPTCSRPAGPPASCSRRIELLPHGHAGRRHDRRRAGQGIRPERRREACSTCRPLRPRPFSRRPARGTSSGCGRTERSASSSTTRFAPPCWLGSRPNVAASCITGLPTTCSGKTPAGSSIWPTTSTPPATTRPPCPTRFRPPSRPAPNTPWRSPSSSTASPSAAPHRPTERRSTRSPRDWATC